MSPKSGKIHHAHGLVKLISSKLLYYKNQVRNSIESKSKYLIFFSALEENDAKIHMETQEIWNKQQKQSWTRHNPRVQDELQGSCIQKDRYCHREMSINAILEIQDTKPHIYYQLIFEKQSKLKPGRKDTVQQTVLRKLDQKYEVCMP